MEQLHSIWLSLGAIGRELFENMTGDYIILVAGIAFGFTTLLILASHFGGAGLSAAEVASSAARNFLLGFSEGHWKQFGAAASEVQETLLGMEDKPRREFETRLKRALFRAVHRHVRRTPARRRRADRQSLERIAKRAALSPEFFAQKLDPKKCAARLRQMLQKDNEDIYVQDLSERIFLPVYDEFLNNLSIKNALAPARLERLLSIAQATNRDVTDIRSFLLRIPHHRGYRADSAESQAELTQQLESRPAAALIASNNVVPYMEFGNTLRELLVWCNEANAPRCCGRFFAGRAGVGKTRLALETCRRLEDTWTTIVLSHRALRTDARNALREMLCTRGGRNVFLVVDYAETRPEDLEYLCEVAKEAGGLGVGKIRIMAIARSAGEWWRKVIVIGSVGWEVFGEEISQIEKPLTPQQGGMFYHVAARAFIDRLAGTKVEICNENPDAPEDSWFREGGGRNADPLSIAMRALVDTIGVARAGRSALEDLGELERQYWSKAHRESTERETRESVSGHIALISTLVQGMERRQSAVEIGTRMGGDGLLSGVEAALFDPVSRVLQRLYPAESGLGPVEPDLIGEHIVGSELGKLLANGGSERFAKFINLMWEKAGERKLDLLTVLNRATRDIHARTGVRDAAAKAIEALGCTVFDEPHVVATVCQTLTGDIPALLATKFNELDKERLLALWRQVEQKYFAEDGFAHELRQTLLSRGIIDEHDAFLEARGERKSAQYIDQAKRLRGVGRAQQAMEVLLRASKLTEVAAIADANPIASAEYADVLVNLGEIQFALGLRVEAAESIRSAVAIYEGLSARQSPDIRLGQARAMHAASRQGLHFGPLDALEVAKKAASLYQQLFWREGKSAAVALEYGLCLCTLADRFFDSNFKVPALAHASEAFAILSSIHGVDLKPLLAAFREQVKRERAITLAEGRSLDPVEGDAVLSAGARALVRVARFGSGEVARAAAQTALEQYRALSARRYEAFKVGLGEALIVVASIGCSDENEAADLAVEATGLAQEVGLGRSDELIEALRRLAVHFDERGDVARVVQLTDAATRLIGVEPADRRDRELKVEMLTFGAQAVLRGESSAPEMTKRASAMAGEAVTLFMRSKPNIFDSNQGPKIFTLRLLECECASLASNVELAKQALAEANDILLRARDWVWDMSPNGYSRCRAAEARLRATEDRMKDQTRT